MRLSDKEKGRCSTNAYPMSREKQHCSYCDRSTLETCPECGTTCCLMCGVNLCPLCVRIRLLQTEQILRHRVVPWQHVELLMLPVRRSGAVCYFT
jgi:hypothetical protein